MLGAIEWRYAECLKESLYAGCSYAVCHYAECRGAHRHKQ